MADRSSLEAAKVEAAIGNICGRAVPEELAQSCETVRLVVRFDQYDGSLVCETWERGMQPGRDDAVRALIPIE